jgi:glycosyltransferase involved in cell wall biosynthesis
MAEYIEQAVYSILNQSYPNLELIVVDDNSTDATLEVLKNITDPRLQVHQNKENNGTYFCKNFGLIEAKGDFIAFQDADDISDPYRVAKCLNAFNLNPQLKIVKVSYLRFFEGSYKLWFRSYVDGVMAAMLKKEVIEEIGFFDNVRVSADTEFIDRAKKKYGSNVVITLDEFLYFALQSKQGLTSTEALDSSKRKIYSVNYRAWHNSTAQLYVDFPIQKRPFPVGDETLLSKNLEPVKNYFTKVSATVEAISLPTTKALEWKKKTHLKVTNFQKQIMLHYALSAHKK